MSALISQLKDLLGPHGYLEGADAEAKAQSGWSHLGTPPIVLRPASTEEVSKVLTLCHEAGQPIVAWGGLTGLVESANVGHGELALSLERMHAIEEVDEIAGTATVQAGAILQTVQEDIEKHHLILPLDLGARGSATIGGNIATNAGGNRVIRYGMMRDMVLGLEVVLADGTVLSSLGKMIKDNAGYDLKQLFIGSEGTLGVVTRAVLRLRRKPDSQDTAFIAVDEFSKLPKLLDHMARKLAGTLSAFECLWNDFYRLLTTEPATHTPPLAQDQPYYVLIEAMGAQQEQDTSRFEAALEEAFEKELIVDAVLAKNQSERDKMWAIRDDVGQVAQNWPIFTFDVSLPVKDMEAYVSETKARLTETYPDHTAMIFGHLGDGNLHVIVGVGDDSVQARRGVEACVYEPLRSRGGSVSAEHGVGLEKRPYLLVTRTPEEIATMRVIKQALDPKGILNPGKIFEAQPLKSAAE